MEGITITLQPTPKQHLVYEALKVKEEVFFGGGAGGGKSWLIAESRLINAIRFPGYRSFIGREELKRLMQSTFITWGKVCQHHKIPQGMWKLNGQYNYIEFTNGSRIDLLDLKFIPSDPLYERFGSTEYTDGAIEEAGEVHPLAKEVLKSRIGRHKNKEFGLNATLLITGNPKKNWTYKDYYKRWKDGNLEDNKAFIQSLYKDNPYTAEEYGKQLGQIKDKIMRMRLKDGIWEYDADPCVLIKYDHISDLFTNTVDYQEEKFITIDVARFGNDKTVVMLWQGLFVYKIIVYEKQDLETTKEKIRQLAADEKIPYSRIIADESGVGGGLVDGLSGIKGFLGGSKPIIRDGKEDIENYQNLRTQCFYVLAEYITGHKIGIECEDEKMKQDIVEELEQIKSVDSETEGKLKIIGKDEVKENIGRSPDYSDCLSMRMWFEIKGLEAIPNQIERKVNRYSYGNTKAY